MTIDTRKIDWEEIPAKLRELLNIMENSYAETDTEEAWQKFEETPITLGFGDHVVILPTCAASYNFLTYCLKDMAEEFEA